MTLYSHVFEPSLTERAREFAARAVRPTAADRDRDRRWDPRLFTELTHAWPDAGFTGPLVPRSLGGAGLSATQTCAFLEGLGHGARDPGLALAVGVHAVLTTVPLLAFGSPRQQSHYLPHMAAGEWIGGLSLHQTQGAARVSAVTARPAEDRGWVLTGELDLVACAPVAHHFIVIAAHEDDGGRTAFVVDRDTPGLRVDTAAPAAMRTCPWGRLVLDRCRLPAGAVLGVAGAAGDVESLLAALDWVFCSAPWLGLMRALTSDAIDHVRRNELFGRPLAHAQSARFTLADLTTQCELAAGLLDRAAGGFNAGGRPSALDAATARLFMVSAARVVVDGAARLAGPLALTGDHPVERAHRDIHFFAETGGGAEVLRPVIAASVLGLG